MEHNPFEQNTAVNLENNPYSGFTPEELVNEEASAYTRVLELETAQKETDFSSEEGQQIFNKLKQAKEQLNLIRQMLITSGEAVEEKKPEDQKVYDLTTTYNEVAGHDHDDHDGDGLKAA